MRVGSRCCKDIDEAVAKVAAPLLNLLVHRPWSRAAENRWTYVQSLMKKLALGAVCKRVLPASLRSLQTFWGLSEGLIPTLERIVAADKNEFHAKSKLRLLRVCRVLCLPSSSWQVAVIMTTLAVIDTILYAVLGNGQPGSRARLSSFLSESDSLLSKCQDALLSMCA